MNNKQLLSLLESKSACLDALEWVDGKSAKQAWESCKGPNWLFWVCGSLGVDLKQITLAACKCARLALKFVKEGEERPRICIETTERWVKGEATIEEVCKARPAAADYAADYAAADYAAYAAADAAADAADSAADATYAAATYVAEAATAAAVVAAADAYAAYAAADVASAASAAGNKMRKACCVEIRKVIKLNELLKLAKDL